MTRKSNGPYTRVTLALRNASMSESAKVLEAETNEIKERRTDNREKLARERREIKKS